MVAIQIHALTAVAQWLSSVRACTQVCPALIYSLHQCPGVKPGFIWGYGEKGPTSGLKPQGMKQALGPNTEYPEYTVWS